MNPLQKSARIAGLLYLLQIPLGVFGLIYVPKTLVVIGDTVATASKILANETMFRLSMVSSILTALLTVFTALMLYKVLEGVNKNAAKLMVLFSVMVAPISMLNELNHAGVLLSINNPDLVQLFLDLHKYGVQIAGLFFGLWLLPMGYLVYKSGFIPKVIGIFLMITCLGYLFDFGAFFLLPNLGVVVSEYTWMGEAMMVLWLLVKGVKTVK